MTSAEFAALPVSVQFAIVVGGCAVAIAFLWKML